MTKKLELKARIITVAMTETMWEAYDRIELMAVALQLENTASHMGNIFTNGLVSFMKDFMTNENKDYKKGKTVGQIRNYLNKETKYGV